jgi:hypothetical protein
MQQKSKEEIQDSKYVSLSFIRKLIRAFLLPFVIYSLAIDIIDRNG